MIKYGVVILQLATMILLVLVVCQFKKATEQLGNSRIISAIKYIIPSDNPKDFFSGDKSVTEVQKQFKLINYEFTENKDENEKIFEIIKFDARRLKCTKNSTHAIRIYLSEGMEYGQFLKLLSIMREDGHRRYFEWDNYFYILSDKEITITGSHY